MAAVMLRLRVESKSFRTADNDAMPVLSKIDLTPGQREIVAIMGPSGCGKTTLLRIAGGLDLEFEGSLTWGDGVRPRIGTVFQEPRLLPWRTLRQNLLLAQRDENAAHTDGLLAALDLTAFRDAFPATLSLGMARRGAIARAFAIQPELLILDEPFVSLDPAMAARGQAVLLAAWQASPTTVLLVTHDRSEAVALADRILILGGTPATIVDEVIVPESERRPAGNARA